MDWRKFVSKAQVLGKAALSWILFAFLYPLCFLADTDRLNILFCLIRLGQAMMVAPVAKPMSSFWALTLSPQFCRSRVRIPPTVQVFNLELRLG